MLLHKHHIRAFWQALLVLLAFASCINDDFADDAVCADSDDTPWYLSLQLQFDTSGSSTRATDVPHEEHEIDTDGNRVILLDGDGNLFGIYPLTMSLADVEHEDYDSDDTKEGSYLRLLHVYPRNGKLPESCLVVLNGSEAMCEVLDGYGRTGRGTKPLNEILTEIWKDNNNPKNIGFADSEHKYFTMTNSIYLDKDGNKKDVVSIKNKIYPTIQEALNNRTTVHVERMVAKCTFALPSGNQFIIPEGATPLVFFDGINKKGFVDFVSVKKWRIKITGWGINALETQSYPFKNISENGSYFADWNNSNYYRSYWSEDPHYKNDEAGNPLKYPWQYRKAIDTPSIKYYSELSDEKDNILRNYSYYELGFENAEKDHEVTDFSFGQTVYVPENTYDKDAVADKHDSRDELLAGTHLLVGAELQVADGDKDENYKIYDLYRDRNGIYYESEKDCFVSLVHSFNQSLISQKVMKYTLYDWENGGRMTTKPVEGTTITLTDTLVASTDGSFMLCYKSSDNGSYKVLDETELTAIMEMDNTEFANTFGSLASGTIHRGDGKRLPWLENFIENKKLAIKKVTEVSGVLTPNDEPLKICKKATNTSGATIAGVELWTGADDNDVKSLLYEWLGAVDHFSNGKMYYAAGINNTPEATTAQYGVVRNHWYNFKLESIKSIGVPVDDPTEPIVPNKVSNHDQINVSVYLIPWHEVKGDAPVFFW